MAASLIDPLPQAVLPAGIRSRFVDTTNGQRMHILEAGDASGSAGTVLLLHGFPELAFCWRRLMPLLAQAGYHVVAPDQRGYGRTTPDPVSYRDPVEPYSLLRLAGDVVALLGGLGLDSVAAVVGHDFGSLVAGTCALVRPDLFRRLALLGTPFAGAPALGTRLAGAPEDDPIHRALLALPSPRRHYLLYYAGPQANQDMGSCPQGVAAMLRGYYHHKSADWPGNHPQALEAWSAEELVRMPAYYIMPADRTMAEISAAHMPSGEQIARCAWLSEADLGFVAAEFSRTGFQGGMHWYRSAMRGDMARDLGLYAGRQVECPVLFLAGAGDWATFQSPGALEAMSARLAPTPITPHFIAGAGHWLQQEQPTAVAERLIPFLSR
ncbi:alpha/beta fold hydrolase [Zavarzinia sp. CC-PAN008]|uniref:alpha/beta fold hydrolase n=1 Tax=Zavarzinia sp. CC-PAN008 TaxID=3243332 RepID=UPI003F7449EE